MSCKLIKNDDYFICIIIKINDSFNLYIYFINYSINSDGALVFPLSMDSSYNYYPSVNNFLSFSLYDTEDKDIKLLCLQFTQIIQCKFFRAIVTNLNTEILGDENLKFNSNYLSEKNCYITLFNSEYLFCCAFIDYIQCFRINNLNYYVIKDFIISKDGENSFLSIEITDEYATLFFINSNNNINSVYEYYIYLPECQNKNYFLLNSLNENKPEKDWEKLSSLFTVKTNKFYFQLNNPPVELGYFTLNGTKINSKTLISDNSYILDFILINQNITRILTKTFSYIVSNEETYSKECQISLSFQACYYSCKTCSLDMSASNEGQHNCIECKENYYKSSINNENCYSIEEKLINWYFDQTNSEFGICNEECRSCIGPTKFNCSSCFNGLYLDNNSCKENCSEGYTPTRIDIDSDYYFECVQCYQNNCYNNETNNVLNEPKESIIINEIKNDNMSTISLNTEYAIISNKENVLIGSNEIKPFDKDLTLIEFKNQILNDIASYVNSSKVINGSNFLAIVLSSDSLDPVEQVKNGIPSFDLGNCTNIIKEYYNISYEENLIILNIELKNDENQKNESNNNNDKSFVLGKKTQLEIYDYTGRKLDLSVCKEDIKILKYIGDIEQLDLDIAEIFYNQGIDVFNAADEFFNNICYQTNFPVGKDIIIKDRRSDFYQNASFCQNGCSLKGINYILKVANCICNSSFLQEEQNNKELIDTKKEVINFKNIGKAFIENLFDFNFEVLKCTNLVFNIEIIKKNIGFYCLSSMFAFQIIFVFAFLVKRLNALKYFILKFEDRSGKDKQKKKNINIINNRNIKNSKCPKNKVLATPPSKKINNKFHKYNRNKKNLMQKNSGLDNTIKKESYNILKSQELYKSKTNLTKNLLNSKNNKNNINSQIPHVYNKRNLEKRNNLYKDKKEVTINKVKEIRLINIKNNIYTIDPNKQKFSKKALSNKIEKSHINSNSEQLFQSINDLQDLDYEDAIILDKRSYLKIYWGFLVDSQIILGTFCTNNYLDIFIIKLSFFTITFQISFFLNALFYTDEYISDAYHNEGILDFISGLPKSIYSFVATLITTNLLRLLSSSKGELMKLIKEKRTNQKYFHLIKLKLAKLSKKLIIYFILIYTFSIFFLYYVTAFCAVYRNSQKYWFYGFLESFCTDCLVSFIISIFIAFCRYISIKNKIKCFYILGNIISTFL